MVSNTQIWIRYFGPIWILLYHPRYWRTCLRSWPSLRRDYEGGWFLSLWMIEAGTGMAK